MAELVHQWNVWETQAMVFLSCMLQLFLLGTGSRRRRNINGVLKASIWLAYVGADFVAVYALGLFSQYEKYKPGRESFGDTLPFLWVPFLLVHLGGQDSITAFSIEDNNLWLRHLLNLVTQGCLAMYVFWKSFHRISNSIFIPAMFVFVSGIIKYGERVWALKSSSRDSLGQSAKLKPPPGQNNNRNNVHSKESYALQTVLLARGLFVGRTVLQLGEVNRAKLVDCFKLNCAEAEERLKMVVMELGMMFDLLYTKANVLQRCTGIILRCAAQILVAVAFVLFIRSEKHEHNRVNVSISYALFLGAILMECTSIGMVIWSPWTRAHFKVGSHRGYNKQSLLSNPVGQFNLMDWSMSEKSTATTLIRKVVGVLGMEQLWRNLWHIKHVEAKGIVEHIVEWFDGEPREWFTRQFGHNRNLNYTLSLPFEHALYRLHIYTDMHLSTHFADFACEGAADADGVVSSLKQDCEKLKEDCEKLSNYMIYLMVVHPSMLPVSTAAQDLGPGLLEWVRKRKYATDTAGHQMTTKLDFLEEYGTQTLPRERYSHCPFELAHQNLAALRRSLEGIREMWVRLLIYAAGKCPGELHARQLANGGELLSFVWLLMVHHGLGDVARELSLLTSDDPFVPEVGSIVAVEDRSWRPRQVGPRYAFEFHRHHHSQQAAETIPGVSLSRERQQIQIARNVQQIVPQVWDAGQCVLENTREIGFLIQKFLSDGETEQDGATAHPAGQDEVITLLHALGLTSNQLYMMTAVENEGSRHE